MKTALIDLNSHAFSEEEFLLIKEIINILNPIKITLEALCHGDMTLCKADAALPFMLKEILTINCALSTCLYRSLRKRIDERRNVYSTLLNFLKNPNNKSEFDNNLDMVVIKTELKQLILRCSKNSNSNNSTMMNLKRPIVRKLNEAIEKC